MHFKKYTALLLLVLNISCIATTYAKTEFFLEPDIGILPDSVPPKQSGIGLVDTCLFNNIEFIKKNANSFSYILYCTDIEGQTRPYAITSNRSVTREQMLEIKNNPKYSENHIFSVTFTIIKERGEVLNVGTLFSRAAKREVWLKKITYLMTLKEYEKENGKLTRAKQMGDIMAAYLGKTKSAFTKPPTYQYDLADGKKVYRWIQSVTTKIKGKDRTYQCNQEFYTDSKGMIFAFYHDCGWGKWGEVPLSTPAGASPPPPSLTPEALATRVKSPVDKNGIPR